MSSLEKGQNVSDPDVSTKEHAPNVEHSPERRALERKLLWKIDARMSILIVIYILNYIDRNNAAAARNRGFSADLHLKGQEFPTLLSILYVGYILMQVPSNMLLNYMGRPSLYLPGAMIIWGVISCLTGITNDFTGALLTRFFLGFVEAAFFPGALFLLSKWYTRREIGLRTALLYCGNIISNAFGSLMASGILAGMGGKLGHAAWRQMAILHWYYYQLQTHAIILTLNHEEGSLTVFIAIIAIFVLPDFPTTSKWLSPEERELALLRLEEDVGVGDQAETETGGPFHGLVLAVTDWKVWWFAFALTAQVVALSFNAFFPTLTQTLGYSPTVTLLLCAPPFAVAAVAAFALARHSDKVGERCFHMIASFALGLVGFIIAISTMNTAARYISLFLMAQSYAGFVVMYTWMSNSFPRPPSKRAVALALMNAFSQLGNISGMVEHELGELGANFFTRIIRVAEWSAAWGSIADRFPSTTIIMCLLFRVFLQMENKKLEKEEQERGITTPGFRYVL
ncbi:FCP1-like proteiny domain-containing protein [Mycena indigotica]|uniref:FCP1-like proteiny domain-containing protein n=1 Tax=Mycena indigotica TaxID=2126181 RepID=A0A8H6SL67_9AGAR|nr:FCP1-like proteiny domain-containing protein [Mycena indigotica]KAF7301648.1 FCP1-like proteiny domain-containing protein [Mycena indigotica]